MGGTIHGANRRPFGTTPLCGLLVILLLFSVRVVSASKMHPSASRTISGVIVDHKGQVLRDVIVIAAGASGEQQTTTNEAGQFTIDTPVEEIRLRVEGQYIKPEEQTIAVGAVAKG